MPGKVTTIAASSAPMSMPSSSASVGDDAEQLALDQPALELAPLLRACSRRGRARSRSASSGVARVLQRGLAKRAISSTARRDFMKQIVRAPLAHELGQQVGRLGAATLRRAPSASSVSGGFHIAIVARAPRRAVAVDERESSRPVSRSASSTGLAIVALAIRNRGAVP